MTTTLENLIPKGLDDIIRLNREYAEIRHANEDDLKSMLGEVAEARPKLVITNWHLITIALIKESGINGPNKVTLLLGDILDGSGNTWITSAVTKIDFESGYLLTHSGSRYMMHKQGEGEPTLEQLALLCKRMHVCGSGEIFGVPHYI